MKSRLLGAVCACLFSASANAAVVLFDRTEILFNAGGSANTIAGGWSANSMTIPAGADVSFFTLEVSELFISDGIQDPYGITLYSITSPETSNAGLGISLCSNPVSCVATVGVGSTATIDRSSNPEEWTFLARIIQDYVNPFRTSGPSLMGWLTGGFDVSGNGILSIEAYGESVVPIPPAIWLFASGLLGLVGVARRKKQV